MGQKSSLVCSTLGVIGAGPACRLSYDDRASSVVPHGVANEVVATQKFAVLLLSQKGLLRDSAIVVYASGTVLRFLLNRLNRAGSNRSVELDADWHTDRAHVARRK